MNDRPITKSSAQQSAMAAMRDTAQTTERLLTTQFDSLWQGFELLRDTLQRGNHVHVCGNGGSAADAQHFVTELVVRLDANSKRRPLPATSLASDPSILTAAGNDFGFDQIFARQIEARAKSGDLLVLISTSGNSPNLLAAASAARTALCHTLALLGKGGGQLAPLIDRAVIIPSDNTQRIQEVHALCLHLWCEWLEGAF
ncbi:MAG TPA: SIS domain-containing protein [candidate division Zixibacteria bacterium]